MTQAVRTSHAKTFLKATVTVGLLWWVFHKANVIAALDQIARADWLWMALGVVLLLALVVPAAMRWGYVLRAMAIRVRFRALLAWMLAASFFNQVLPSTMGGDVLRAEWCRRSGVSLGSSVSSILIDRLCALAATILLCAASLPIIVGVVTGHSALIAVLIPLAGAGALGGLLLPRRFGNASRPWLRTIAEFSDQLASVLLDRRYGWLILLVSAMTHLIRITAIWFLAIGLHIDVSFLVCVALIPICLLIATVPITFGGWGLREGIFVVAFSQAGVPSTDALALSVSFGLAGIAAALPGALAWQRLPSANAAMAPSPDRDEREEGRRD